MKTEVDKIKEIFEDVDGVEILEGEYDEFIVVTNKGKFSIFANCCCCGDIRVERKE